MKSEITYFELDEAQPRPLVNRFKSAVMDLCCHAWSFTDKITTKHKEIRWQDHLRWFLEGQVSQIFCWALEGSDEEILSVYNTELPLNAMCPRQRSVLPPDLSIQTVHCTHCGWEGPHFSTTNEICPNRDCRNDVYLDFPCQPSNQKLLTA